MPVKTEKSTLWTWNRATEIYRQVVDRQINGPDRQRWLDLIQRFAPKKEKLKVLDIGTGPGFFPIILGMEGHDVTAVDVSVNMLRVAKEDAEAYGVKCEFRIMNADTLDFPDDTFDLILNRNVSWIIPDLYDCYREWRRVLAPHGRIIVFDSNFVMNLFSEDVDRLQKSIARQMVIDGVEGNLNDGPLFRTTYWEDRPMTGTPRPLWDRNMLLKLRYVNVRTEEDVRVIDPVTPEHDLSRCAPMFVISGEKPSPVEEDRMLAAQYWGGVSPLDGGRCHLALSDGTGERAARAFSKYLPSKGRILDLGCGAGLIATSLRRLGYETVGVDYNDEMVAEARRCAKEAEVDSEFVQADASDLPFDDGSFDGVLMRNSLWCMEDAEKAYSEAIRVLRHKGVLLCADGNWVQKVLTVNLDNERYERELGLPGNGFGGTDIMNDVFGRLSQTIENRPSWDAKALAGLGANAEVVEESFDDPLTAPMEKEALGNGFLLRAVKRRKRWLRRRQT